MCNILIYTFIICINIHMCVMNTKGFIGNILWRTILWLLLSNTCKGDNGNISNGTIISKEITSATIITSNTTSITTHTSIMTTTDATTNTTTTDATTTTTTTDASTTPSIVEPPIAYQNPLVLCKCRAGEVMNVTGHCQPWVDGTTVPAMNPFLPPELQGEQQLNTNDFSVTVQELKCPYNKTDLLQGEFILRLTGATDLLVTGGKLRGLRVTDYCLHHQWVDEQVKVIGQGCVSEPKIPRCCPVGKHMINGNCTTKTPVSLPFNPPLWTGPHGNKGFAGADFPWADRQEYINKPSCEPGNVLEPIKLDGRKSYLAVLPRAVLLTWQSKEDHHQNVLRPHRENVFPPQYCVDIQGDDDMYYAYSCKRDLDAYCKDNMCTNLTNKCCQENYSLSLGTFSCIPVALPFQPPFPTIDSLTVIHGFPSCTGHNEITNFTLLQNGSLIYKKTAYNFDQYCTENFIGDNNVGELRALACIDNFEKSIASKIKWHVWPVCYCLSIAFLGLFILLHMWIPKLRENEGKYHVLLASSLFIGFCVSFIFYVLPTQGFVIKKICMSSAFVQQFSSVSAVSWLSVICFDIWRLFRNCVKNKTIPVSPVASWKYLLFGFGGPLVVTVLTMLIQFLGPTDGSIAWLIHPQIDDRCWFKSNKEIMPYYFGPILVLSFLNFIIISSTYYYIKIIRRDIKSDNDINIDEKVSAENETKKEYLAVFSQQFYLLVVLVVGWVSSCLAAMIPPENLWLVTDILNSLEGVFVFFVFFTHPRKRGLLKEKLPELLDFSNMWLQQTNRAQANINTSNKMLEEKIFPSSFVSRVNSSSSFNLDGNNPSSEATSENIIPLSLSWKS